MLSYSFQWGVRQSTEVENQMVSVERVIEYSKLKSEAALESPPSNWTFVWRPLGNELIFNNKKKKRNLILSWIFSWLWFHFTDQKPPSSWPLNGQIQFNGVTLRYSETDEPVLKDITCSIAPNEKVFFHIRYIVKQLESSILSVSDDYLKCSYYRHYIGVNGRYFDL